MSIAEFVSDQEIEETIFNVTSCPFSIELGVSINSQIDQILYFHHVILIPAGAFIHVTVIVSEKYKLFKLASVTSLKVKSSGVVSPAPV